jgi:nicotinamide-nucleotide amidase
VNIELINTGSELMLGFVLNTHQQWICRQLADAGRQVSRQVAIADAAEDIQGAVRESLARADFVIVTGGLGPTSDDLTRDLIADLLGKKLLMDRNILDGLEKFFARLKRVMPESAKVQAMVPEGALVLENRNGTAPGLAMEVPAGKFRDSGNPAWLVMLPGPPRELRPMFTEKVLPLLAEKFPLSQPFACRTLRTTGIPESLAEEAVSKPLQPLVAAGMELGYCAHIGQVDIRLVGRGPEGVRLVEDGEAVVRSKIGKYIFGTQDEQLNEVVVKMLIERKKTLVLAESCTGGHLANQITNVPGASEIFLAGLVTYSNQSKQSLLGVSEATLAQHGAVSEAAAREMAQGARAKFDADFAVSVTGIAGPGGGTPDKPVGTVFIALASREHTFVLNPVNRYDRLTFKQVTSNQALELLWRNLK